eukprot:1043917-Pyramimonas_sp.AAC.1
MEEYKLSTTFPVHVPHQHENETVVPTRVGQLQGQWTAKVQFHVITWRIGFETELDIEAADVVECVTFPFTVHTCSTSQSNVVSSGPART